MINYYKCEFTFNENSEIESDILTALLGEIGFDSFDSDNNILNAYILENLFDKQAVVQVLDSYPFQSIVKWDIIKIEGQDWNEEWEKNSFKPIVIEGTCAIHSSAYEKFPNIKYDILINPKMSFGTGSHETTTLMIKQLLANNLSGKNVLDVGTGTGILAILSSKMGAKSIIGVEIDPVAVENAKSNFVINEIDNVEIYQGDVTSIKGREENFDLVLANINRNILIHDIPYYSNNLKIGGHLQLSGFYTNDAEILIEHAKKYGLSLIRRDEKNDWNILVFIKD